MTAGRSPAVGPGRVAPPALRPMDPGDAATRAIGAGTGVLTRPDRRTRGGDHLDIEGLEVMTPARRDAQGPPTGPDPASSGARPAVFLDRDGTVIEHVHYLSDPAQVRLIPGAAGALRRLRDAGYALVLVTNQSAVGRGMLTVDRLGEIHGELARRLAAEGVALDGVYYCPEVPDGDDRTAITHVDRKPGPGMLLRAMADLGLDPGASWMVGDLISDVLAGVNARCRGSLLVGAGGGLDGDEARALGGCRAVPDLPAAADVILGTAAGARPAPRPEGLPR